MSSYTRSRRRSWALAIGAIVFAAASIVLLKSRAGARPAPVPVSTLGATAPDQGLRGSTVSGPGLSGLVALSQSEVLAGAERTVFAELTLVADETAVAQERRPTALALVLDVSGSMTGEKIEEARRAAQELVRHMRDEDHLSIVAYNNTAWVQVPYGTVGPRRGQINRRIRELSASGGTNIPSALTAATNTLAEAPLGLVRRVVLVSDGIDGSSVPLHIACATVREQARRGSTLSALGVGSDYDERFLTSVADAGSGNYEFLANAGALGSFLGRELDEAATTALEAVAWNLSLPQGVSIRSVHGADYTHLRSQQVHIGSMRGGETRRAVVELRVDPSRLGQGGELVASPAYRLVGESEPRSLGATHLAMSTTAVPDDALASRDSLVHASSTTTAVDARQAQAIEAWRSGRAQEALELSARNRVELETLQAEVPEAQVAPQLRAFRQDDRNFRDNAASSHAGRSYGLESNAHRRGRAWQQAQ